MTKTPFIMLVTGFLATAPLLLAADSIFDAPPKIEDSVVMISCVKQDLNHVTPWKQTSMARGVGSGFIISGNRILTNAHNISNQKYIEIKKQNSAKRYPATVAFAGHDCDLAILTVADQSFYDDFVPLAIDDLPVVNSTVQTYGFPLGGRHVSVTEGVVSRIQISNYSHTQFDSHLVVQTDAAINPGNSGGPVVQDGRVVGVAFQGMRGADNIGYMIPTTVINHFLADIADGTYDGFGSLGFSTFPGLHNKAYGQYLKVPQGQEGVVVLSTLMHSSVEAYLKPNDVITKIDDYNIDNDGMIKIHGLTVQMSEAIEQKQIGETATVTFFRDGKENEITAKIALNRTILEYSKQFDLTPKYEVFAGLTFVPLTRNYLESWGESWISDIPFYLRYLFIDSTKLNTERKRDEYVVLSEILDDQVNMYAASFEDSVVESINGIEIFRLNQLPEAFAKSKDGFCTIRFMGRNTPLIIDYEKAAARHPEIMKKYNVPAQRNSENI